MSLMFSIPSKTSLQMDYMHSLICILMRRPSKYRSHEHDRKYGVQKRTPDAVQEIIWTPHYSIYCGELTSGWKGGNKPQVFSSRPVFNANNYALRVMVK